MSKITAKELIKQLEQCDDENKPIMVFNESTDEILKIIGVGDEQYFEGNQYILVVKS